MRTTPIHIHEPGPGVLHLEDDSAAPLLAPEHMLAMALTAKGNAEAAAANAQLIAGHLTTVICALVQILKDDPATAHLVDADGMIVIPAELGRRVTGMQIEAIETGDGDVGIIRRERAPELLVVGGRGVR